MKPGTMLRWIGLAVITVVVVFLWRWSSQKRAPASTPPPPVAPSVVAPVVQAARRGLPEEPAEAMDDGRPGERNEARPEAGTGEGQLEHLFRGVLEANAEGLKLSAEQVDRLVFDYLEYQEIHAELVMRFLQETGFDPSSVTLRVPAYPVEGKVLRDMFYRRLGTDFPEGKAAEINEQLGGFFDHAFRGFGVTEQSFKVKRSPEVPDAFEVQWEANVPEGQPTGALNPDVSFAGSSGTLLLYREQVESGEFRFLGPVVTRRFPPAAGSAPR